MLITGVNDTGDKLFSGVNDTGDKFYAGVVDTGEQFIFPRCGWYRSEKTKKPKIYRWCQRHRRKIVHHCGVNDTTDKFFGGVSNTGD